MTKTEELFIEVYRGALHRSNWAENSDQDDEILYEDISIAEWRRVLSLANCHCVYPMVFESIYRGSGTAIKNTRFFEESLKRAKDLTRVQARRTAEFLKLYQFLAEQGLHPIVMKGILCRSLYPAPEQRLSSDEDLLVPEADFPRYHKALTGYGLKIALPGCDADHDYEVPYCNDNIYIEVHKRPFYPGSKVCGDLNRFFTDAEGRKVTKNIYGVPIRSMEYTDHLFYQLCHAYKHFLYSGIGIRVVSDIILCSMVYFDRVDWETVTERCREIHAFDLMAALYKIGQKYLFPERFPEGLADVWGTDSAHEEAFLADILKGGVLGASSVDRLHSANLTLGAVESAKTGIRSSSFLRTLFPSVESLKGRYLWLRKAPILLPAAWLHRIAVYSMDDVLHGHEGHRATDVIRIGNERVDLLRRYHMLEERKRRPNLLERLFRKRRSLARDIEKPVKKPLL